MSPIRPERRDLYPENWPEISRAIRVRADFVCECDGRCGKHSEPCTAEDRRPHPDTGSRVVLTVAHLNHDEADCREENLAAYCQRCHLAYDADHHAATRRETARKARADAGQLELT